jgi:hypothetical protein
VAIMQSATNPANRGHGPAALQDKQLVELDRAAGPQDIGGLGQGDALAVGTTSTGADTAGVRS